MVAQEVRDIARWSRHQNAQMWFDSTTQSNMPEASAAMSIHSVWIAVRFGYLTFRLIIG